MLSTRFTASIPSIHPCHQQAPHALPCIHAPCLLHRMEILERARTQAMRQQIEKTAGGLDAAVGAPCSLFRHQSHAVDCTYSASSKFMPAVLPEMVAVTASIVSFVCVCVPPAGLLSTSASVRAPSPSPPSAQVNQKLNKTLEAGGRMR